MKNVLSKFLVGSMVAVMLFGILAVSASAVSNTGTNSHMRVTVNGSRSPQNHIRSWGRGEAVGGSTRSVRVSAAVPRPNGGLSASGWSSAGGGNQPLRPGVGVNSSEITGTTTSGQIRATGQFVRMGSSTWELPHLIVTRNM